MHPKVPDNLLVTLLRQCYSTPCCRHLGAGRRSNLYKRSLHIQATQQNYSADNKILKCNRSRSYATSSTIAQPSNEIAVLGGGITGLASAFYLTKELPDAKITIYEASDTLGGWLRTKHIDVGNGSILFEQGPRTLRAGTPAGTLTVSMIYQLGLLDEVIATSKNSVAAKNRFVYYPDRLVEMPHPSRGLLANLWSFMTEPIYEGSLTAPLFELTHPKRAADLQDESVGSFFRRRVGTSKLGDNIVSAVLHGIYAGDIEQLSAKSLFPRLWDDEGKYGSISAALFARRNEPEVLETDFNVIRYAGQQWRTDVQKDSELAKRIEEIGGSSVYSFKKGIGSLTEALENYLRMNPNVKIQTSHPIDKLEYMESNRTVLISSRNENQTPAKSFSRVISTVSGRKLSSLAPNKTSSSLLPTLALTHSVTVMVINLYFKNPDILPVHGFGYLIPRSISFEQNPECALGVVFDSDASIGQDSAPGTKVTVMMGGHWWDDSFSSSYPTEEEGAAMAKAVLKRHLNISEEPAKVIVSLQRECIPQYTVGHGERMKRANSELMSSFGGRLAVAGNSYTGVGVNDCVKGAWDVVLRLKDAIAFEKGLPVTGLEQFLLEGKYIKIKSRGLL